MNKLTVTQKPARKVRTNLWFEKILALLALGNYILVLFDLSYIPLRDFWLQGRIQYLIKIGTFEQELPPTPVKVLPFSITPWYDWVKGIEPYRETQQYLEKVEELNEEINRIALGSSDRSTEILKQEEEGIDRLLQDLRDRSVEIIENNPFQVANKTGTLERIKNKMRVRVLGDEDESSTEAFRKFWSRDYLIEKGYRPELNFFDRQIKPLIETNYYRPVGENGEPIDNFGLLDLPFFIIFGLEFLARSWYISRRRTGVSWFDAMLWRWYDIFLLIPIFRWLRIIPVTIRLNQAKLIDLQAIQKQASQGFVASIAEDITEVVVIQIVNQVQSAVRHGEISNLLARKNVREYIDINQTNETTEIVKLMLQVIIAQVLPKIRTDIEALLIYNVNKIVQQSPGYQNLQQLPGVERFQNQLTEQLVKQVYQVFYSALKSVLEEDPQFDKLVERLVENFSKTMGSEIKTQQSLDNLESLLVDLLEEIKINYIKQLSQEDVEAILEQTRSLKARVR